MQNVKTWKNEDDSFFALIFMITKLSLLNCLYIKSDQNCDLCNQFLLHEYFKNLIEYMKIRNKMFVSKIYFCRFHHAAVLKKNHMSQCCI